MILTCATLFGIVLAGQAGPGEDARVRLEQIGAHSYFDYSLSFDAPGGYEKLPMVRIGTPPGTLKELARAHPGRTWLIGNEPDQLDQDGGRSWDEIAQLTHQYVTTIKEGDPTATTVGPNMLSTSRDKLIHFKDVPFDIWGVHVYVPEEHLPHALDGWPHPLWVTEFGTGSANPAGYVQRAVESFWTYGAVRWFLFSSDPIPQAWGRSSGNWITSYARADGQLTPTGALYQKACQ